MGTIQLKRSTNAGSVPSTAQLAIGELAINAADGKVYLKTSGGVVVCIGQDVSTYTRTVGVGYFYTGTTGLSQGYFDDFDGKWVYLTSDTIRTIGNASSGAAIAATWTATLFTHIWNQYSNTQCPLLDSSGNAASRGSSAASDYAANRRLTLPDVRGRGFISAGAGSGLTARTQHAQIGEESHTLTTAELPSHFHPVPLQTSMGTGGTVSFQAAGTNQTTGQTSNSTGGGGAHNTMQPSQIEHFIISAGAR